MLDHGCSFLHGVEETASKIDLKARQGLFAEIEGASSEKEEKAPETQNKPIRQSLLPLLSQQGTHEQFVQRGISEATCNYLGCGYLDDQHKSTLRGRIIFQVRGLDDLTAKNPLKTILTHMGRAVKEEEKALYGKWSYYKGFKKSLELYNIDNLLLDSEALQQIAETGKILIVEGCFDVAKCVEAGLKNILSPFGAELSDAQLSKLQALSARLDDPEFLLFFDRDRAGSEGQQRAVAALKAFGLKAQEFDWEQSFPTPGRGPISIPAHITDPAEFSCQQLSWLREKKQAI